ncbi:hypothetical protein CYMTET_50167 [Cymbomonas tetramitiformis]|uniref:SET domain-containing protein n=1 Tax=Cymbomonas tetramitiformis TaxID=36881 RepID=A0AAE0BQA8_9CHLO|nr:hypothetical protein CYMTET_50167 [Cymbomonas tetramitiformis]
MWRGNWLFLHDKLHGCSSLQAREECNSFALYESFASDDVAGYGVYPGAAMFNHSCIPNVYHAHHRFPGGGMQVFRTLRRVEAGEELLIRYSDIHAERGRKRRDILAHWCFDCRCPQCAALEADQSREVDPYGEEDDMMTVSPEVAAFEATCLCPARHVWPQQTKQQVDDRVERRKKSGRQSRSQIP